MVQDNVTVMQVPLCMPVTAKAADDLITIP
jgi:hypothetical protein